MDHLNQKFLIFEKLKKIIVKLYLLEILLKIYKAAEKTCVKFILKINSENYLFRKKNNLQKINSFKYLENKLKNNL